MLRTYAAGVRGIRTASGLAYRPEGRVYDLSEPETGGSAAVGGL
jgi:hypothetical protein